MNERLVIEYEGEPDGMRRAVSNAFRLRERDTPEVETVDQRVTITVRDQPPEMMRRAKKSKEKRK